MQLYCDFDGTITGEDATDYILTRLADPAWEDIERDWKDGLIGSGECMRQQIALIKADIATLDATLDEISIDPHFVSFIAFCRLNKINVTIVSDGVDYFIRRILARVGLAHLPIIANKLDLNENGFTLESPYARLDCASAAGVCKCRVVDKAESPRIYIGDGRSDFCVANKPEIVFAKSSLATYCAQHAIPYVDFGDFSHIVATLGKLLPVPAQHLPANVPAFS
jgi:2-hydroxy-3-keto-5-methylthiopentenyl-1-phosphate phosphatase